MKISIQNYFERVSKIPDYYANEDFGLISKEIKNKFDNGVFLIERIDETDVSIFETEFGYKLPLEIERYINLFWHPCISGYFNTQESIVLFPVIKKEGDSNDDLLFYKNGLITMAKEWRKNGDIQNFIPIGWSGYSGGYVLYEVSSNHIFLENIEFDGEPEKKPIADSLKELINHMYIRKDH
ncbi:MAG: hypothetical protein NC399_08375 [Muribaculum sp.]|nr:hypothetical protein [Muribaculum sp.]